MAKFVFTVEAESLPELRERLLEAWAWGVESQDEVRDVRAETMQPPSADTREPARRGRPPKNKAVTPAAQPPQDAPTAAGMLAASVKAGDPNGHAHMPDDAPDLETLKSLVTSAVKLAMKGESDRKILDLLPDFKAQTGLDFVMNAKEEHRLALFELLQNAEIPLDA